MLKNEALDEEFSVFILTVPVKRLKQNILRIFFYFLKHECTDGSPEFIEALCEDLEAFFDLLDAIDREVDQSHLL